MAKHVEYYNNKVKFYRTLGKRTTLLKAYFYLQERYYYNEVSSSIEYKDFINIYKYIFDQLAHTMDELDLKTIENIFAYSCFLLDSGILAYDKDLTYKNSKIESNELPILSPLALNKHGKCRHNASLLRDLINYKGHSAYILVGIREELDSLLRHQAVDHNTPNHAITIAEDSEFSYMLDPSTEEVFERFYDGEIYSNNFTKFTLCKDRIVPLGDEMYFELFQMKPIKRLSEIAEATNKTAKSLASENAIFEELHTKIKPALKDAEKIYQRILNP